jgi:hypothetical protein
MSYRQLRKIPGLDNIVKDLAEKQNRAQPEAGVEDLAEFGQARIDTDNIAYADADTEVLDGDKVDTDAIAHADAETTLRQTSGQFAADGDFFCGNGSTILETDKPQGAFAAGTGNFDEPAQPAVANFTDAGA